MTLRSFFVTLCVLTAVLTADAQTSKGRPDVLIGASAGLFSVGGDDFDATDDGPGVGGYLGVHLTGALNVLGGIHYSSHEVTPTFDLSVLGLYVEPRLIFDQVNGPVGWFIGARLAWVQREVYTYSSSGYGAGGIAGLVIGPDWAVRIEPAISATYLSFSRYSGSGDGDTGSAISLQIGVSIPLGRSE